MSHDEPPNSETLVLGVDIGATKIALCVGTADGRVLDGMRLATLAEEGPGAAMDRIRDGLAALAGNRRIHDVVGVIAPGPLSSRAGRFINPPNLPLWHGFEIVAELQARLGRRVRLMNDANAAALAEWRFGAGRGCDTLVYFTYSTGMGAGLIVSGRLHEGADDLAGEIGHLPIAEDGPVGFGRRGSLEGYCSGQGLAQLAVMHLIQAKHTGRASRLFAAKPDFRQVDSTDVGHAADAGDPLAQDVLRESGRRLGGFAAWLVDVLNPDALILGTIGRAHPDIIIPEVRREIDRLSHPAAARRVRVVPAALGETTGDVGALCAAFA